MKVTLYMAVSSDGNVCGSNGETPWSDEEWQAYSMFVRSKGNLIVGHRTYDLMKATELHRLGDPFTVVVAHHQFSDPVAHVAPTPLAALVLLKANGFSEAVVGGGPTLNQAFFDVGLIDEVVLDVENVKLGGGLKLFGNKDMLATMRLVEEHKISPRCTQQRYTLRR